MLENDLHKPSNTIVITNFNLTLIYIKNSSKKRF